MFRTSKNIYAVVKTLTAAQTTVQTRAGIARWVAPTLRELRRRSKLLGPQAPSPRSGFIEWNYRAELFAFGKRLQEEFQLPILQNAFTERSYVLKEELRQRELGIEVTDINMQDNRKLAEQGEHLAREYVKTFLQHELPKVPEVGHKALISYLLSTQTLAHIAQHLGMKELIYADVYPPTEQALANSLLAVIGALAESSGIERAFVFVRDFICTQLNQRDFMELWLIDEPMTLLQEECAKRKIEKPEARLIGDCAKNTVLAAYNVGIYVNKKLIGKGFGEDVPTAIETAALDALFRMYGLGENMRPLNFELKIEPKSIKRTQSIEQ